MVSVFPRLSSDSLKSHNKTNKLTDGGSSEPTTPKMTVFVSRESGGFGERDTVDSVFTVFLFAFLCCRRKERMKERTKKERKKEKGLSDGKVSTESVRNTL